MQKITVDCLPDGKVAVETDGFSGKSCEEATAQLEKALGVQLKNERKPEYYQGTTGVSTSVGSKG